MAVPVRFLWLSAIIALAFVGTLIACSLAVEYPQVKVQFVSPNTGWIVGPRLLRTVDGGRTWAPIRQEGHGTFRAEDIFVERQRVQFINQDVGWILGGRDTILKTTDGGYTWPEALHVPVGPKEFPIQLFFFITPGEGWAVGEYIYYTSNGGQEWRRLGKIPEGDARRQAAMRVARDWIFNPAIRFLDSKRGLMARLDGEVYVTADGGLTWELSWRADRSIHDIFFVNVHDGWLVGQKGLAARTNDGGRSWAPVQTPTELDLNSVFFTDEQLGWSVGEDNTILYTTDGGSTWQQARVNDPRQSSYSLISVSFADETHGWAVGGRGNENSAMSSILTTNDGGRSWSTKKL